MIISILKMRKVRPRDGVTCLSWDIIEDPGKEQHVLLWDSGKEEGVRREDEEQGGKRVLGEGVGQELDRAQWPLASGPSLACTAGCAFPRRTQTVSPEADQASATKLRASCYHI